MLFFTWFTVDGCYAISWYFKNPVALALMRDANFLASLSLYGICGVGWFYQGTLRQLYSEVLDFFHVQGRVANEVPTDYSAAMAPPSKTRMKNCV